MARRFWLRTTFGSLACGMLLASLSGCGSDGPTKADYVRAMQKHAGLPKDMSVKDSIPVLEFLGADMCKSIKQGKALDVMRENPAGKSVSVDYGGDYGTRFMCPKYRDEFVKAGGRVLDIP